MAFAPLLGVSRFACGTVGDREGTEQRALDGEMAELTAAWQEAEEIAGIADNLLLPPGADEFIERHRQQ